MVNSDDELIRKSLSGEYEAYSELVNRYSNMVFALALSKTRDSYQAEDIAQEVFVKAWTKLASLEQGQKFAGWIATITKNQCMDHLRKASRLKEESIVSEIPESASTFQKDEIKDLVWDAVNGLEEKYRIVLIMNYISGYTAKEIAKLLHITQGAIESRLRRAKEQLKKELVDVMENMSFGKNAVGKEFTEEVMWRIVPRIATIEIPVSNIQHSIDWYSRILGIKAVFQDEYTAMLHLQGGSRIGVPTIYLVQTEEKVKLGFKNSHTGVIHSVIDFYIKDLERFHTFLKQEGIKVTDLNFFPGSNMGGFGFEDPDGHLLSATNVTHTGQV